MDKKALLDYLNALEGYWKENRVGKRTENYFYSLPAALRDDLIIFLEQPCVPNAIDSASDWENAGGHQQDPSKKTDSEKLEILWQEHEESQGEAKDMEVLAEMRDVLDDKHLNPAVKLTKLHEFYHHTSWHSVDISCDALKIYDECKKAINKACS